MSELDIKTFRHNETFQAVQLTKDADWFAIADWCGGIVTRMRPWAEGDLQDCVYLEYEDASAWAGDWIVRYEYEDEEPDFRALTSEDIAECFEARSHGEVLARVETVPIGISSSAERSLALREVPYPPGTEVLVVLAPTAEEAGDER